MLRTVVVQSGWTRCLLAASRSSAAVLQPPKFLDYELSSATMLCVCLVRMSQMLRDNVARCEISEGGWYVSRNVRRSAAWAESTSCRHNPTLQARITCHADHLPRCEICASSLSSLLPSASAIQAFVSVRVPQRDCAVCHNRSVGGSTSVWAAASTAAPWVSTRHGQTNKPAGTSIAQRASSAG